MGGSSASLSKQHTFSFPHHVTLAAPFLGAFPHGLFYVLSAENRVQIITLDLNFLPPNTCALKQLDKTCCPTSRHCLCSDLRPETLSCHEQQIT